MRIKITLLDAWWTRRRVQSAKTADALAGFEEQANNGINNVERKQHLRRLKYAGIMSKA